MENIALLVIGLFILVIGIINMTGNISTIHWYNRRKVTEDDMPKYGKCVGLGTIIIGSSIIVYFILINLNLSVAASFVLIPAIVLGLGFILYAQFKYNKGIF